MTTVPEWGVKPIEAATAFIADHNVRYGRLPTSEEFLAWSAAAPSALRLDGIGFQYQPSSGGPDYAFEFWEGDVWVTWRPQYAAQSVVEIAKSDYFVFDNKLEDLLFFLGIGTTLLSGAILVAPWKGKFGGP